jgi:hypothetical protein
MKSIKIITLLILLLGFFTVKAQQSNTEVQKHVNQVAVEQTDPTQPAANQPPAGAMLDDQGAETIIQPINSMAETELPAANEEGANAGISNPDPDQGNEPQVEADGSKYSGMAANKDPNEVLPIDK